VVILDVKFGPRLYELNVRAPLLGLFHVDARLDAVCLGFVRGGDTAGFEASYAPLLTVTSHLPANSNLRGMHCSI